MALGSPRCYPIGMIVRTHAKAFPREGVSRVKKGEVVGGIVGPFVPNWMVHRTYPRLLVEQRWVGADVVSKPTRFETGPPRSSLFLLVPFVVHTTRDRRPTHRLSGSRGAFAASV